MTLTTLYNFRTSPISADVELYTYVYITTVRISSSVWIRRVSHASRIVRIDKKKKEIQIKNSYPQQGLD